MFSSVFFGLSVFASSVKSLSSPYPQKGHHVIRHPTPLHLGLVSNQRAVEIQTALRTKSSLNQSNQSSNQATQIAKKGESKPYTNRRKRSTVKSNIQPTARSVAITALANAAASTYPSCSSPGSGAQVNAASFASRLLDQDENYKLLEARDRSFARLLVATVERRLGQIDKVLKCCIEKYPPKKGKHSHLIQATLRTGAAQLLFLDTPSFASNQETVQALRNIHLFSSNTSTGNYPVPEAMVKFVNGVFRTLSKPIPVDSPSTDTLEDPNNHFGSKLLREKTSPHDNIAPWLLKRWKHDWGDEKTKLICDEIMPYDETSVAPHIDLTTKYSLMKIYDGNSDGSNIHTQQDKLDHLLAKMGEDAILLPQGSIRVGPSMKGDVKGWPEYEEGTWWVQDASATLPALVLINALRENAGKSTEIVLNEVNEQSGVDLSRFHCVDMCAAPGGKTCQLVSAGFGKVTAIEANPRRSRRLMENLERLQISGKCEVVVSEGQSWMPSETGNEYVNGILVDVPCSATGTGARRPDVLRRSSDLSDLLKTQEMLANHCADKILSVGGVMVYATCSILKEESEDQVQKLIDRGALDQSHALMETLPIKSCEVPGYEGAIDENGWLRVLPGVLDGEMHSTDGFFVARLVRVR